MEFSLGKVQINKLVQNMNNEISFELSWFKVTFSKPTIPYWTKLPSWLFDRIWLGDWKNGGIYRWAGTRFRPTAALWLVKRRGECGLWLTCRWFLSDAFLRARYCTFSYPWALNFLLRMFGCLWISIALRYKFDMVDNTRCQILFQIRLMGIQTQLLTRPIRKTCSIRIYISKKQ